MTSKIVTYSKKDSQWLDSLGDSDSFMFIYHIINSKDVGKHEEKKLTQRQNVIVKISRTNQQVWDLENENNNLEKVLFQYAFDHIRGKIIDGSLLSEENVSLCNGVPDKCPYDPESIELKYDIPIEVQTTKQFGFKTE